MNDRSNCKGCGARVRLSEAESSRILEEYLRAHPDEARSHEAMRLARLAQCRACPDLLYGSTCRYCGCLVEILTRLASKRCPRPGEPRW